MPVNNGTDNTLRITVVSRLRTALSIDQLNLLEMNFQVLGSKRCTFGTLSKSRSNEATGSFD